MSISPDSRHLLTLQKNTIFVSVNKKSIVGNQINKNRKKAYWLECKPQKNCFNGSKPGFKISSKL